MSAQHTPGPWIAQDGYGAVTSRDGTVAMVDNHFVPVAERSFPTQRDERTANARLIAAAPDMLEALENIENDDAHMPSTAWDMIQNAICKAKGGQDA